MERVRVSVEIEREKQFKPFGANSENQTKTYWETTFQQTFEMTGEPDDRHTSIEQAVAKVLNERK